MRPMLVKQYRISPESSGDSAKRVTESAFEVIWKDLSYKASGNVFMCQNNRHILNNISGSYRSGQVMAIMGPSGCGKSSLLGCLSGAKTQGVTGSITISTNRKMKFAFIAQDDYLEDKLTVYESLMYVSRLKYGDNGINHSLIIDNVVDKLNIESCIDTKSNRCSGGQRKRISIALELVSRPDILILDEPTSGLDSVTTSQLIDTLLELTQQSRKAQPMAIVITIHQPSGKLFQLFNSVYVMSTEGQCLYHGPPKGLVTHFDYYGLKCPEFHNPSDFALEVAAKEHGMFKADRLVAVMDQKGYELWPHPYVINIYRDRNTWSHLKILTKKTFQLTIRDSLMLQFRVVGHIVVPYLIIKFWGSDSGVLSGCADNFVAKTGSNFVKNYEQVMIEVNENIGCIFFIMLFIWFGSLFSVVLTFPQEIHIFLKEYRNGWYSCFPYYMSKVLVDLLFQLTIPNMASIPCYIMTGQYWKGGQEWRLYYFVFICMLIALSASSQGLLIGAWLMRWPSAAAFIALCTAFPFALWSGFLIPLKDMPSYFSWISWLDFFRFSYESIAVTIYGYDRCEHQLVANRTHISQLVPSDVVVKLLDSPQINLDALYSVLNFFTGQDFSDNQSLVVTRYDYKDRDLYFGIGMLIVIMVGMKLLAYLTLLRKVKTM